MFVGPAGLSFWYTLCVNSLLELIKTKQAELSAAESRVLELRREMLEAREELLKYGIGALPGMVPDSVNRQQGNSTEWAEAVLRKSHQPMHVNEIISAIERDFGTSVRYATIVGNISRLVKKNKIFERTGPNRFGLREWHASREADELFGRELQEQERIEH